MGINMQNEAFFPHVGTMTLLPVILLSLLQDSLSKTVETVLRHYTFKMRPGCPATPVVEMQAASPIEYGTMMIVNDLDGLLYNRDTGSCALYSGENTGPLNCWRLVPSS